VPLGSPEPRNESKLQGALVVASPLAEAASQERRTLFDHVSSATQRARWSRASASRDGCAETL